MKFEKKNAFKKISKIEKSMSEEYRKIDPQNPTANDTPYQLSLWDKDLHKLPGVIMPIRTTFLNPGDKLTYFMVLHTNGKEICEDRFFREKQAFEFRGMEGKETAFYKVTLKRIK